jgi:hypothetical protein
MARRIAIAIAWGLAGLAFAVALTAGAFAVAGPEISRPAPLVTVHARPASPNPKSTDAETPRATASPRTDGSDGSDDHGGLSTATSPPTSTSGSGSSGSSGAGSSESPSSGSGSSDDGAHISDDSASHDD